MRYNPTERLGVIEASYIVTKDLGWIFREQSVVDIGIDAIIEQVESNNPTGRFVAVQVKSGLGHFHRTAEALTLYVSNIHYNYWTNSNLPVILIAHIPNEATYWQELSKKSLEPSKTRWKVEIPLTKKLNKSAAKSINKVISKHKIDPSNILYNNISGYQIEYDELDMRESIITQGKIAQALDDMSDHFEKYKNQTLELANNLKENTHQNQEKLFDRMSLGMMTKALRIESEAKIFAFVFSKEVSFFGGYIYLLSENKNKSELKEVRELLILASEKTQNFIDIANGINDVVKIFPQKTVRFSNSQRTLISSLELLIDEYTVAKNIILDILA